MVAVTVVIPTYNRKEFLQQAVETVRLQTHDSLECIVVDDGSTDGTGEYLDSVDYSDLETIYHDENHGQSVARNAGIEAASGKYVLFLDSDDILYPNAADTLISAIENQPKGCVGVFSSTKLINHRGRVTERPVREGRITEPTLENVREIGGLSSTMFERTVLKEFDGFDESLSRRVDLDLYLRILKRYTLVGVGEVCCERRIHESQMSNDKDEVGKSYDRLAEKHDFLDF